MTDPIAIDRSAVLWESAPGVTNAIEAHVVALGGWVCEQHPWLEWPHDECAGPGMPALPEDA
jgi:hypothetical protein